MEGQGLAVSSLSDIFAAQAWGSDLTPDTYIKPDMVSWTCNPISGKVGTGRVLEIPAQPTQPHQQVRGPGERPCLKKLQKVPEGHTRGLTSALTHIPSHACTDTEEKQRKEGSHCTTQVDLILLASHNPPTSTFSVFRNTETPSYPVTSK